MAGGASPFTSAVSSTALVDGKLLPGPEPAHPSKPQQPWLWQCHAAPAKLAFTEQRCAQVSPLGNFSFFFHVFIAKNTKISSHKSACHLHRHFSMIALIDGFPHPSCLLIAGTRWEPGQLRLMQKAQLCFTSQILRGSLLKISTWLFTNKPKEGPAAF